MTQKSGILACERADGPALYGGFDLSNCVLCGCAIRLTWSSKYFIQRFKSAGSNVLLTCKACELSVMAMDWIDEDEVSEGLPGPDSQ